MSQFAEPVIAGLEVIEHFGEAREVLARLIGSVESWSSSGAPSFSVRGW